MWEDTKVEVNINHQTPEYRKRLMVPNYSVSRRRKRRKRRKRRGRGRRRRRIRQPPFLYLWSSKKFYTYPQTSLREEIKQNKS
jgi:hypothetical protein